MWCDDFDMDLPKVIPDAETLLGDMAGVTLFTHGNLTHGTLNHPTVWNHDLGLVAFFGFAEPRKPAAFYTNKPLVECTFLEAVRDAWAHSFVMLVEGQPVLDAAALWPHFENIMWRTRGWAGHEEAPVATAEAAVRIALARAADALRRVRERSA